MTDTGGNSAATEGSLCERCGHCQMVVSGKGSRFLLCRLSQTDRRFAKYPPQPVVRCAGFEPAEHAAGD